MVVYCIVHNWKYWDLSKSQDKIIMISSLLWGSAPFLIGFHTMQGWTTATHGGTELREKGEKMNEMDMGKLIREIPKKKGTYQL